MERKNQVKQEEIGTICKEIEKQAIEGVKWIAAELRSITKEVWESYSMVREINKENQEFFKSYHKKQEYKTSEYNR